MPPKYLRFEQMEVFRPMPVPASLQERIRQESEEAKQMARASVSNPEQMPIQACSHKIE